jgi:hypothetical protein
MLLAMWRKNKLGGEQYEIEINLDLFGHSGVNPLSGLCA